jgi:hypothetical protein
MIPSNITYENVLEALHTIDRNGIPPKRKAKKFFLIFEGQWFYSGLME